MKRYIFTHRNGIHIIDLQQTLVLLEEARKAVRQLVAEGGDVLFVGTKKQAQESIETEAKRCGMPYVNQRWLGGTLTNFQTISSRIGYMVKMENSKEKGEFQVLTKKESLKMDEKLERLQKYFGGIRDLKGLPQALFVIDLEKEDICVAEARRIGIPVVAVVDSNCDPRQVTIPIPGNDDAIRSIRLMSSRIADAVLDGLREREAAEQEREAALQAEQEREATIKAEQAAMMEAEAFASGEAILEDRPEENIGGDEEGLPEVVLATDAGSVSEDHGDEVMAGDDGLSGAVVAGGEEGSVEDEEETIP